MKSFLKLALLVLVLPFVGMATVTSTIDKSSIYTISGLPQTIPISIAFNSSSDLLVLDFGPVSSPYDPATVLTLGSDYTVTGGGYNTANQLQTGTIVVVSTGAHSVAVNDQIVVMRNVTINQASSFTSTGPLTVALLEQALDKTATISQQLNEIAGRSLQFENFEYLSGTLSLASRKGMILGFDATTGSPAFYSNSGVALTNISANSLLLSGTPGSNYAIDITNTLSGSSLGVYIQPTQTATANSQNFVGVEAAGTVAKSTYTGLTYTGVYAGTPTVTGNGTIATSYQVLVAPGPTATSGYGIYQSGTDNDYFGGKFTGYNNVATAGTGVPAVYGSSRVTGQVAANSSVASYTNGSSDATFIVGANANCTAYSSGSFSINVSYTDEGGTARTVPFQGHFTSGYGTTISGTGAFEGQTLMIRAKASTTITITTSGTFTSLTYNAEGSIMRIN